MKKFELQKQRGLFGFLDPLQRAPVFSAIRNCQTEALKWMHKCDFYLLESRLYPFLKKLLKKKMKINFSYGEGSLWTFSSPVTRLSQANFAFFSKKNVKKLLLGNVTPSIICRDICPRSENFEFSSPPFWIFFRSISELLGMEFRYPTRHSGLEIYVETKASPGFVLKQMPQAFV